MKKAEQKWHMDQTDETGRVLKSRKAFCKALPNYVKGSLQIWP